MQPSDGSLNEFLAGIDNDIRRRDAVTLVELMRKATGEEPRLWGNIIGFGRYDYRYESGREGSAPAAGFSPRKAATTIYLAEGVGVHQDQLDALGPHTTGKVCVYIKDLEAVDLDVLATMVSKSYATVTAGTFADRAKGSDPAT